MSKNFVREIDGIKNINKQEYYTNKANDLLSTKEHNYIRKETEEYHCLTDNVKQTKATNVRYTDTTAKPNVNYNLLSVDNSQVPKTNANTISATSLVEALEAKDQQIQKLEAEMATEIETLENKLASLNEKQPLLHCVSEFAGNQFFNMQTTQIYNFNDTDIDIYARVAYRLTLPSDSNTRNFDSVLQNGARNFEFDNYNITLKKYFIISGDDMVVTIDSNGTGLDFRASRHKEGFLSGEIIIKFRLANKLIIDAD